MKTSTYSAIKHIYIYIYIYQFLFHSSCNNSAQNIPGTKQVGRVHHSLYEEPAVRASDVILLMTDSLCHH
jgi:hypothetical protein